MRQEKNHTLPTGVKNHAGKAAQENVAKGVTNYSLSITNWVHLAIIRAKKSPQKSPMYYRRKILLSLLEVFGNELEKIRLQKLLLLSTQKQEKPAYDFVPYTFGCFSFHANAGLIKTKESLANAAQLCQESEKHGCSGRLLRCKIRSLKLELIHLEWPVEVQPSIYFTAVSK